MGEWSVGQWIVGVISLQKMYGLYGLKSIYIGINAHVTDAGQTTTSEDRATQLLICEPLSLAMKCQISCQITNDIKRQMT